MHGITERHMNQYSKRRWNRFPFTNNTRSISIIVKVAFSSQSFKIAGGLKESPHGCCDKVLVRLRMTDASRIVHRIPTVLKEPSCIIPNLHYTTSPYSIISARNTAPSETCCKPHSMGACASCLGFGRRDQDTEVCGAIPR